MECEGSAAGIYFGAGLTIMDESISCPFCGLQTNSEYEIMLHMETRHPEGGESPFVVKDDASIAAVLSMRDEDEDPDFASCPADGCGEVILLTELENHIEMHEMENQDADHDVMPNAKENEMIDSSAPFDTKISHQLRNLHALAPSTGDSLPKRQENAKAAWSEILNMPQASASPSPVLKERKKVPHRRLGKSELGPHANEYKMPPWLVKLLESDGEVKISSKISPRGKLEKLKITNHESGIVPVLAQLLSQDRSTKYAFLCHPGVKHISKLKREGGFCGYRNIQMLTSYINEVKSQGHQHFNGKIPTIFAIQDNIEHAWDLGINAQGRVETGGIRGTRKYIGTPDAQAMFCSLGIACDAQAFRAEKNGMTVFDLLIHAVEVYFTNGCTTFDEKMRFTSIPPLYFQHPGHSMTIVGMERKIDGSANLIVFDPMFHDASNVTKLVGQVFKHKDPEGVLKAYRRGLKYLGNYREFELLKLTPPDDERGNVVMGSW